MISIVISNADLKIYEENEKNFAKVSQFKAKRVQFDIVDGKVEFFITVSDRKAIQPPKTETKVKEAAKKVKPIVKAPKKKQKTKTLKPESKPMSVDGLFVPRYKLNNVISNITPSRNVGAVTAILPDYYIEKIREIQNKYDINKSRFLTNVILKTEIDKVYPSPRNAKSVTFKLGEDARKKISELTKKYKTSKTSVVYSFLRNFFEG